MPKAKGGKDKKTAKGSDAGDDSKKAKETKGGGGGVSVKVGSETLFLF